VKRFGYVLGITLIFVFTLFTSGCSCSGGPSGSEVTEATVEQSALLSLEQQQDAVLGYIQTLSRHDEESYKLFSDYLKLVDAYFKLKTDAFTLYDCSQSVKQLCFTTYMAMGEVPIPEGVPSDTTELLREACSNLKSAWFAREMGVKDIMKYLDMRQVSKLESAKQRFEEAEAFTREAAVYTVAAKESVGIEIARSGGSEQE